MKIELIYFEDCPNAGLTRENLKKAFEATGTEEPWHEWEQSNPDAPDYVQQYGSPTILVDGKDIADGPGAPNSCRIYEGGNAPSVEMIKAALGKECCG